MEKASLIALQHNQPLIAENIHKSIYSYIHSLLDNGGKIDIVEILHEVRKLKFVGSVALEMGCHELQEQVADDIRRFETDYLNKLFPGYPSGYEDGRYSPSPTALRLEKDEFGFGYHGAGMPSYFKDVEGIYYESYSRTTLQNFENYIWPSF